MYYDNYFVKLNKMKDNRSRTAKGATNLPLVVSTHTPRGVVTWPPLYGDGRSLAIVREGKHPFALIGGQKGLKTRRCIRL